MCKDASANGVESLPYSGKIKTGIEPCQKSGVFINSSNRAAVVESNGLAFTVGAGKSVTMPIGADLAVKGTGDGLFSWTVTSAVLAAQVQTAPTLGTAGTAPGAQVLEHPGATLLLSSGSYTKLVIIDPTPRQVD